MPTYVRLDKPQECAVAFKMTCALITWSQVVMFVVQDAQQNESRGLVWDELGGGGGGSKR